MYGEGLIWWGAPARQSGLEVAIHWADYGRGAGGVRRLHPIGPSTISIGWLYTDCTWSQTVLWTSHILILSVLQLLHCCCYNDIICCDILTLRYKPTVVLENLLQFIVNIFEVGPIVAFNCTKWLTEFD